LESLRIVSVLLFAAAPVGVDKTWEGTKDGRLGWFALWVFLFIGSGLAWILIEQSSKRVFSERARAHVVRKLLATLASIFKDIDANVRTNVMLVTEDGRRRKVQSETAHNMEHDPDDGLEMDFGSGVSGLAARRRKPAFGNLRYAPNPGSPDWGLSAREQACIRKGLQSILSVPIFDPDDPRGQILGTLQVDSDQPMDTVFADPAKVEYVATTFADALALLLKDGG
jgi:hypothetical protein